MQPDIKTRPRDALSAAHAAALDSLLTVERDAVARFTLATVRDGVLAQATPRSVAAQTLASYTGTYEGGRVVALDDGVLVYRRDAARPPRTLVAANDTTFVLNGNLRITFERAANGQMQMMQQLADGSLSPRREPARWRVRLPPERQNDCSYWRRA